MKTRNKVLWVLTLIPVLVTIVAVQYMPDKVPMHYDSSGTIDRWGSKYENFLLPVIIIISTLIWIIVMRAYEKKQLTTEDEKVIQEAKQNSKVIYYTVLGTTILFSLMQYFIMYSSFLEVKNNLDTMAIDINMVVNVLMGFLLMVIGNIMPKCKMNSMVGLRTTWSMKNDIVWAKSNRLGGISLIISGLLIVIETLIIKGIISTIVMIAIILLDAVASVVISYRVYKNYVEQIPDKLD